MTFRVKYKDAVNLHSNKTYTGTNGIAGPDYSTNANLNQLLQDYSVNYYAPYYSKFAVDTNLKKYYAIEVYGNVDSFFYKLQLLNLTYTIEYSVIVHPMCTNPVQINDMLIALGWSQNWALERADAACAWTIEKGNTSLRVAIVDTDFDVNHEDLQTNIREVYGPISSQDAHGTTVLGTAGADANNIGVIGAGYNLKWDGARVIHYNGGASNGNLAAGVTNAANKGARVINISWSGTGYSRAAILDLVNNQGVVVVVPAGNSPNAGHNTDISDIPGVILVSGIDKDGYHGPSGHARNSSVELCAVSRNVTCTVPGNQYGNAEGTSNAAPQVAATAGLILSISPCFTPAEVEYIITSTTKPILDAASYAGLVGTGYLDMYSALKFAKGRSGSLASNETWTETEIIGGNLIILSGVTLTIKTEVICHEGSSITVKPGGKLILDGGKLRSICNSWKGVIVEGNASLNQINVANQGSLKMINVSTISDALNAVSLLGYDVSGNIDFNKTGGFVQATNSKFVNNKTDIWAFPYHPKFNGNDIRNKSRFDNCTFETNDNLKFWNNGNPHVAIWDASGFTFSGCKFINSRSFLPNSNNNIRKGITSFAASYSVNSYCTSPYILPCPSIPSEFINLRQAVESYGNGVVGIISIENAIVNSYKGISLQATNGSVVRANNFTIGHDILVPGLTDYPYGLYLDRCQQFNTEGNQFTGTTGTANVSLGGAAGLVIRNTGANNNNFYRSNFDNLKMASQALSENRDAGIMGLVTGLTFQCNDYENTWHDLDIRNDPNNPAANPGKLGMKELQGQVAGGYPDIPQNSFANTGIFSAINQNIENQGNWMQYIFTGAVVQANRYFPFDVTSNVLRLSTTSNLNSCQNRINTWGTVREPLAANWTTLSPILMQKNGQIKGTVDGGNTPGLLVDINTANGGNVSTVVNQLISLSPFLSEKVLARVAEMDYPFTNEMIRDILVSNPHSARSLWVQTNLDNRGVTFPYTNQVNNNINVYTQRDTLGAELAAVAQEFDNNLHELLYSFNSDTNATINDIVPYLKHPTNPNYHYQLAERYFDAGDWSNYLLTKDSIDIKFDLDTAQILYHQSFTALFNELHTWQTSGTPIYAPDASRKAWLLNFASTHQVYHPKLNGLLAAQDTIIAASVVIIPETGSNSFVLDVEKVKNANQLSEITLYPNPAKHQFSIQWKEKFEATVVDIYDINGKLMTHKTCNTAKDLQFDTHDWPSGIYFVKVLKFGSNEAITRKVIVE